MKHRFLRYCLLAGVVLLVAGLWLLLNTPEPTSQRLSDGSTVSLLGISYGRKHVLLPRPIWQRAMARLLPEKAARRIGIYIVTHTTTNDTLMVWSELRGLASPANQMPSTAVTLSDGHGTEIFQPSPQVMWGATNCMIQGTLFSVVPRGSNQLRVLVGPINSSDAVKQTAVFNVANPAPRLRPVWQASPFPVEAQAGDLKFVLTRLRPLHRQEGKFAETDTETWMSGSYRIFEGDTATTHWRVANIEVFDEAGGRHQLPSHSYSTGAEMTRKDVEFRGGLGTNGVWKLRLTLAKSGGFSSNEVVTVERLPIPTSASGSSSPVSVEIQGVKLSLHSEFVMSQPRVVASLAVPDESVQLTPLRLVDRSGARIECYAYRNITLPETEFMNVTVALSRLCYVELLVRPEPPFKYSPSTFPAPSR